VQYTYRGAYLNALNEVIIAGMGPDSVYLWTLPMFHCNGWCFPWAVTAAPARHVTMRAVDPQRVWELIDGEGVTHYNGAPTVQLMIINHPRAHRLERPVTVMVAAAPPSPTLFARMSELNFGIVHVYGPTTVCPEQEAWPELPLEQRATYLARQGQAYISADLVRVVDGEMNDIPQDGQAMGEVVMRGNIVMSGYFDDEAATGKAFAGGWFHSGDLAVWHPDGNIELRDRGKDIIISGGENISSIEVEQTIAVHPGVLECAVIGIPDLHWGAAQGVRHAQGRHRGDPAGDHRVLPRSPRPVQVPRRDRVRAAAEDLDRQGPEVRATRTRMGRPGQADRRGVASVTSSGTHVRIWARLVYAHAARSAVPAHPLAAVPGRSPYRSRNARQRWPRAARSRSPPVPRPPGPSPRTCARRLAVTSAAAMAPQTSRRLLR
jgi:acyl-CoA synthetase (AMP-forming)/AMP-acid ligase II